MPSCVGHGDPAGKRRRQQLEATTWVRRLRSGRALLNLQSISQVARSRAVRYQLGCLQSQHIGRVPAALHLALPPQQGTLLGSISRFGQPAGGELIVGQYSPEVPLRTVAL